MFKAKRFLSMLLACIMVLSMSCVGVFASDDEIPDGLPEGAYKIRDGIYAVDNFVLPSTRSALYEVNIGTVYPLGQITQPSAVNNFVVSSNHRWICIRSFNAYMRINFVRGTTSIFGSDYYDWPAIGTSSQTTYFIDAEYYNFTKGAGYQLQCTSGNSRTYNNVVITIVSSAYQIEV